MVGYGISVDGLCVGCNDSSGIELGLEGWFGRALFVDNRTIHELFDGWGGAVLNAVAMGRL